MGARGVWLVALLAAVALAEVTILRPGEYMPRASSKARPVQYMYNRAPELRIRAKGFENVDEHDILLDISATGQPSLRMGKDYLLFKNSNGDGIILKLLSGRRWANLEGRTRTVALVLIKVAFKQSPDKNVLSVSYSLIVAQVLQTPTAAESVEVIYTTMTNELRIKGTGFAGAKGVDFYFDPPLYKEVGYEIVTRFPTIENQIVLRLRHGYKWRDEPGPLKLVGIDWWRALQDQWRGRRDCRHGAGRRGFSRRHGRLDGRNTADLQRPERNRRQGRGLQPSGQHAELGQRSPAPGSQLYHPLQ